MYMLIIGVALSAIGLLAGTLPLSSWRRRLAVALVGVVGVALLIANHRAGEQRRAQSREATRFIWGRVASKLTMFELDRQSKLLTEHEARWMWNGMGGLLLLTGGLCIPDSPSCDVQMATSPPDPRFGTKLRDLIAAFETGEPCPR